MRFSSSGIGRWTGRSLRTTGMLGACLIALTLIPVSGAHAGELEHTHRSGEYLAFVSERSGNDELYLSRPDGSEVEQLTDSPGFDRAPSWGSSGKKLVFNSRRDPHSDLPQIYSLDIVSGETTRLTESDQEEHRASLHEENNKVYFHRGSFMRSAFELWEKDLTTGDERQLTQSVSASIWNAAAAISPDGQEVLFQSNRGETEPTGPFPQKLHLFRIDSGEITAIPEPDDLEANATYDGARWNSQGTAIVFSASTAEGSVLYIAERTSDGSWVSQAITEPAMDASAPAWSPSGTEIVFQAENPESDDLSDIVILNLSTGDFRTIGEGRTPVWSVVNEQEMPAPTISVEGLKSSYLPGDRLELTSHHDGVSASGNWKWFIQREGEPGYSVIPSQNTSVLTIEELTLAESGARIITRLYEGNSKELAESEPVTLLVQEGEGEPIAEGGIGDEEQTSGALPDSSHDRAPAATNELLLAKTGSEASPRLIAFPLLLLAGGLALLFRARRHRSPID